MTSRSMSAKGAFLSSTASTTEKIAVLAPMPSARVRTQARLKAGVFRKDRRAYRRSLTIAGDSLSDRAEGPRRLAPHARFRILQGGDQTRRGARIADGTERPGRLFAHAPVGIAQ